MRPQGSRAGKQMARQPWAGGCNTVVGVGGADFGERGKRQTTSSLPSSPAEKESRRPSATAFRVEGISTDATQGSRAGKQMARQPWAGGCNTVGVVGGKERDSQKVAKMFRNFTGNEGDRDGNSDRFCATHSGLRELKGCDPR